MIDPVRDGVATAWLNRPDRGNALSPAAVEDLSLPVAAAAADVSVHTLLFRGRGKHFCTGFDISNLESESDRSLRERFVALEKFQQSVWHATVRTAAFATGRTWGAGADLFASTVTRRTGREYDAVSRLPIVKRSRRFARRSDPTAAPRIFVRWICLPRADSSGASTGTASSFAGE